MILPSDEWAQWQNSMKPAQKLRMSLLRHLLEAGGAATVGRVVRELLPNSKSEVSRQRAFHRFIEEANAAASAAGLGVHLRVDGAKSDGDERTVAAVRGLPHEPVAHSGLAESAHLPEVYQRGAVRLPVKQSRQVAVVATAADQHDARDLFDRLSTALATSSSYSFTVHFHASQGNATAARKAALSAAIGAADLWILCLSNAAAADDIHAYLADCGRSRCVPIALSELANLPEKVGRIYGAGHAGIGSYQAQRAPANRTTWINGLTGDVHARLKRDEARAGEQSVAHPRTLAHAHARMQDVEGLDAYPLRGKRGLRAHADGVRADVEDVLQELESWAAAEDSLPLAALLGEYGMGKTITSQLLARSLWARATPDAHYFDLRDLPSTHQVEEGGTIIDVLAGVVRAGWSIDGQPFTSAEQAVAHVGHLLERSRKRRTVWILDGLDEILVHLSSRGQVSFLNQALRLRPRGGDDIVGADNRLLLTCRTHYFPTLQAQVGAFTDHHRSVTTDLDYLGLVLLPLTDDQIASYLDTTLQWGRPRVQEFLASVHDLGDLSSRPFLLSQIERFAPRLEERALGGIKTTAAGIYVELVADWLTRDAGKHEIADEHKVDLMGFLAAQLWRAGIRSAKVETLNRWLFDYLTRAELLAQYGRKERDALVADLRTATFLVRPDAGDGDTFRFAHTSFQEFFLAHHLLRALESDRRSDWQMPLPSRETLRFLGELLNAHPHGKGLLATLELWRSPYLPMSSEVQLGYGLVAREVGLPAPRLSGMDLRGAQLAGWTFTGTASSPLDLSRCAFTAATLARTTAQHVRLDRANLGAADVRHVVWDDVSLRDAGLAGSRWDGAVVRGSASASLPAAPGLREIPRSLATPVPERRQLSRPTGHTGWVGAVAYSPDGARVVSAGRDGSVRCWDAAIGQWLVAMVGAADGSSATWRSDQTLTSVHVEAWRWLRVTTYDAAGRALSVDPYEWHYPTDGGQAFATR